MRVIIRKPVIKLRKLLFVLLVLMYCMTSSDSGEYGSSLLKYGILFICIIHSAYEFFSRKRNSYLKKEYYRLYFLVIIILLYSIYKSLVTMHFSFRTVQEILFLVCPMVYSYFVVNTWKKEDINGSFKIGLIIAFLGYIVSLGMNIQTIYYALLNSSFGTSYSELESFTYCGLALGFCLYFCYFNENNFFTVLSFLFVVMTFKRIFLIIAIVLVVISKMKVRERAVPTRLVNCAIVVLFIVSLIYFWMMQPENVVVLEESYGIDISKLTMTRSDRMRWLLNSSYKSYGFGSSTEYMYAKFGGALEMEASKFILELGILPLALLFFSYMKYAKVNMYVFIFMGLMMGNLILSSGLTGTFSWCIIFIAISEISICSPNYVKRVGKE